LSPGAAQIGERKSRTFAFLNVQTFNGYDRNIFYGDPSTGSTIGEATGEDPTTVLQVDVNPYRN